MKFQQLIENEQTLERLKITEDIIPAVKNNELVLEAFNAGVRDFSTGGIRELMIIVRNYIVEGDVNLALQTYELAVELSSLLTDRQLSVLMHICEGLTLTEIAKAEGIKLNSVKSHIERIHRKASKHGLSGKLQLIAA